jgi:hypothetical protein
VCGEGKERVGFWKSERTIQILVGEVLEFDQHTASDLIEDAGYLHRFV